jgi:hypothetical protein
MNATFKATSGWDALKEVDSHSIICTLLNLQVAIPSKNGANLML